MTPYAFLHIGGDSVIYDSSFSGYVFPPEGYSFISAGAAPLPVVFDNSPIEAKTFSQAANIFRTMSCDKCVKMKLGKRGNDMTLFVNPRFAFIKKQYSDNKELLYIIAGRRNTRGNMSYKIVVSKDFIVDTKDVWLNGLKNYILAPMASAWDTEIECCNDITSKYFYVPKKPDNYLYADDVSKFLKSEEAKRFIDYDSAEYFQH